MVCSTISGKYKINKHLLNEFNNSNDNKQYFGDWINNINELKEKYNLLPFEHIKLDNFLKEEYAEEIYKQFRTDLKIGINTAIPIEVKYVTDDINNMNKQKSKFYLLSQSVNKCLLRNNRNCRFRI